ncbi:MAG: kpsM protein, partial [Rhizobacter sp.]|nr:kpsM protein [Rhizobacter sp.]
LVTLMFFPLYLVSGVVLPIHALPDAALDYLTWNPVLHALEISRGLFFTGYQPLPQASSAFVVECALVSLAIGLSLYRVRRQRLLAS